MKMDFLVCLVIPIVLVFAAVYFGVTESAAMITASRGNALASILWLIAFFASLGLGSLTMMWIWSKRPESLR